MPSRRPVRRSLIEPLLIWALLATIGWNYFHDARRTGALTGPRPPGYYGLLTEALVAGQVHLKLIPDPKLLRLADPYAGPQGTDRPHDMSFYRGKFYLYYGITPALVLMVPWHLLTGSYLTEVATSATLCFAGFLLAALWLLRVRRHNFPTVHVGWILLCLAVLGLGSPVYFLGNNPTFYAVPIAGAFFCLMLAGVLVDRSARTALTDSAMIWLAAASLALGLAVGSRPNYVLGLPLLLLPALRLWKNLPPTRRWSPAALPFAVAAIVPAALVGAGLACYNYLRFGHPAEFGIQYSLASASVREIKLIGFEYYPKNLRLYLLHTADFIRYFPFFHAGDRPFGILPHLSLAGVAILFPLSWVSLRLRHDQAWIIGGLFWLGAATANLAILCLFFGGEDRYLVDFAPPALLLACALLLAGVNAAGRWSILPRLLARTVLASLAFWTVLNGVSFAFSRRVPSPLLTTIEQTSNRFVATLERFGAATHGPIELKLRFPSGRTGQREPLLSTGTLVGTGDIIYVVYPDPQHVQFGFFHLGAGGPLSEPVPVDYAADHTLTLHLGSLYPPRQHPLFRTWSEPQVNKIRRRLDLILDGRSVLHASVSVYVSTPDGVHIGANTIAPDVTQPRFTGQILASRRLGAEPPALPAVWPTGPARITLRLPPARGGAPLPLVSTGVSGTGDLLSLQILDDGRIRFIHDCWGSPDYTSNPVTVPALAEHVIDVEMGSLYPPDAPPGDPALRGRLAVWIDQKLVMDVERPFNPATPDSVEFGFNAIQASSAVGMFTGTLTKTERIPSRLTADTTDTWGPIALTVRFPTDATGLREPLVSTGKFGAADIIIVHHVAPGQVRFGLDHWGAPIAFGPIVEIDPAKTHDLTVTLSSLYPPPAHAAWKDRPAGAVAPPTGQVEVRLGDRIVLTSERRAYDSRPGQVSLGRNDLGASSCRRVFSGEILSQHRLPW